MESPPSSKFLMFNLPWALARKSTVHTTGHSLRFSRRRPHFTCNMIIIVNIFLYFNQYAIIN